MSEETPPHESPTTWIPKWTTTVALIAGLIVALVRMQIAVDAFHDHSHDKDIHATTAEKRLLILQEIGPLDERLRKIDINQQLILQPLEELKKRLAPEE